MKPENTAADIKKTTTPSPDKVIARDASVYQPPTYGDQHTDDEEYEDIQTDNKTTVPEEPDEEDNKTTEEHDQEGTLFYKEFNKRALPRHAKTYCLEKFEKNALIILNHIHVEGYDEPRYGSNEDAAALERTFAKFGFEIERHDDLPLVEVLKKLKAFSNRDFTDYGCVAVAVLTHGTNKGWLRASDFGQYYSEKNILEHFKIRSKPTLFTKPVVLLIQACRGTSNTRGVAVGTSWPIARDHSDTELDQYHLPLECDILVVNSSYAGKSSFRPADGSWFIQTLCKRINQLYKTHHLEDIIRHVKQEVATDKYYTIYNTATDDTEVNKQMPVVTSTLIRKLHLFDKSDQPDGVILSATDGRLDNNGPTGDTDGPSVDTNGPYGDTNGPSKHTCTCKNKRKTKNSLCENTLSSWVKWSQSFSVRTIGICVGVCVMYNLVAKQK